MNAATPGQAFRETLHDRWSARGRCIDTRPYDQLPEEDREDLEAAAWSAIGVALPGVDAALSIAAQGARPAPGPDVCECGHYWAHHAFSDDVCAVVDCPCTRPRPEPTLHQLSGLVAGWRQAMRDLEEQPVSSDEAAQYSTLREVVRQVLAVIESATVPEPKPARDLDDLFAEALTSFTQEPKPAPELAAATDLGTAWRLLDETRNRLAFAGAERDDARDRVTAAVTENRKLRELLDEVGVMAANAPEDGDSFAVCEEIAMRVAAIGPPS